MKRDSVATAAKPLRGERRRLLREYFLNAVTLALMKEAGSMAAPAAAPVRRPPRP